MLNLEGRELGGCRLIRKIGEGGMGEVYLAEQVRVGNRQVAVKVMRPDPGAYGAQAADDAKRRFEREVAILGASTHPNILPIYDSGVEEDYFYIVMQYCPDGSLADSIRGRSSRRLTLPLDTATTVDIVSQVASALQYTHDRNVVHRDVKPANVLTQTAPDGQWRMLLADFGVARGLDNTSQRTQVTGTFTYMAPEQFHGQFSPATDQYALAVMTFQLLTGRPPFEGELGAVMRGHTSEPPPSLRALNPAIPAGIEAAVMRALAKEPGQRFPSVKAYAQALETAPRATVIPPLLPTQVAPRPAAPAGPETPRWPSGEPGKGGAKRGGLGRTWLIALAGILLLASILGAGAYANAQNQNQRQRSARETQTAQSQPTQTSSAATESATAGATSVATSTGGTPVSGTPLPTGVGALVFDSPAPTCDPADPANFKAGNGATVHCPGGSQVDLSAATQGTLACVSAQSESQANGFLAATVTPQSGNAVLGFRQGVGDTTSSGFNITGYYLAVNTQQSQYVIYKVDHAGAATIVAQGALAAQPPATFQMAALFNGSTITAFVNGQALPSAQDSAYQNGWVAACADHSTSFSHVQLYTATQ